MRKSAETGIVAYLVGRSIRARRIVGFGTSFGVSTIYLTAALRDDDDDGGSVIGSEIEEEEFLRARADVEEAGLGKYIEIRAGDAQETARDLGGAVNMALLDGRKENAPELNRLRNP